LLSTFLVDHEKLFELGAAYPLYSGRFHFYEDFKFNDWAFNKDVTPKALSFQNRIGHHPVTLRLNLIPNPVQAVLYRVEPV
jgi:hypothetical protein